MTAASTATIRSIAISCFFAMATGRWR